MSTRSTPHVDGGGIDGGGIVRCIPICSNGEHGHRILSIANTRFDAIAGSGHLQEFARGCLTIKSRRRFSESVTNKSNPQSDCGKTGEKE